MIHDQAGTLAGYAGQRSDGPIEVFAYFAGIRTLRKPPAPYLSTGARTG
jgi:hypothetical protein